MDRVRLRKVRSIIGLCAGLIVSSAGILSGCSSITIKDDPRPNFLIILTDDQRYDTMQYMPHTQELIFDQGVTFTHGYATTPLCCPSRASILTGMYAHNHGVHDNDGELESNTVIHDLHEAGYFTGLVGKYLNSWKGEARPEFDYWVAFARGESRYYNPRLNINGEWLRHQDQYITYALGDYAIEFIEQAAKKNKPFVLVFAPNAPHDPATPAEEDSNKLLDLPLHRPPSFNEEDISDKPAWLATDPPLTEEEIASTDEFRRNQILTLFSLDRTINQIVNTMRDSNELDNTLIIFLSDNGKQWGEHRMISKNSYYEESSHVPFALRYPPLVPEPYTEDGIVANIDIAPTLYDLAGLSIPSSVDGFSLADLLQGTTEWRKGILIEGWPGRGVYSAIHTGQFVYAETEGDRAEFYDLEKDPYELDNLVHDPAYESMIAELKLMLNNEKNRRQASHP
jgi:N-acetylglucosamine-6-sulfatase